MRSRITLLSLPIAFPLSKGTPSEDDDPGGHHHRLLAGIRDVNRGDRFIVNVHRMRRGRAIQSMHLTRAACRPKRGKWPVWGMRTGSYRSGRMAVVGFGSGLCLSMIID